VTSSGSNLGPTSAQLQTNVTTNAKALRDLGQSSPPTRRCRRTWSCASASGLDPHISPERGALPGRFRVGRGALLRDRGRSGGNVFISGAPAEDLATREIIVNGLKLELTAREEAIFQILARRPGALVSCQQILAEIWGNDGLAQLHELRVYITRLRRKLEACGATNLIASERNVGYTLTIGLARESGPSDPASP
jgi:DNA-binding winged helix-turn-helix (wHTH) protein